MDIEEFKQKTIQQIVNFFGEDGPLTDGSDTQKLLQEFLSEIETSEIERHCRFCLDRPFKDSGLVLQDLVNEIGRRLNFDVTNGRYRGSSKNLGFDGIWKRENHSIVVETKTTEAYSIDIDTTGKYHKTLIEEGKIGPDSPILYAVGRGENQSLERQIRGSEYLFTTRVIGIESLIKLMKINETSFSHDIASKIGQILRPIDYIRVDGIVDIVFSATEDKQVSEEMSSDNHPVPSDDQETNLIRKEKIIKKRESIAASFSNKMNKNLIKRKSTLFSDPTGNLRVAIVVSRRYGKDLGDHHDNYWYAYTEPMRKFLEPGENAFVIYGCIDKEHAFYLPYQKMEEYLGSMHSTTPKDRPEYWHARLRNQQGKMCLYLNKSRKDIPLENYKLDLLG